MDLKSSNVKKTIYNFFYDNEYAKRGKFLETVKETKIERPSRQRKNINKLEADAKEKEIFMEALETSIKSGEYSKLVTFHSQFMFDIHSFSGTAWVNQRFLPWHRVYLVKFEEMLNIVMKKKDTTKDYNIAFPYWDWEHDRDIPKLFKDLTPTVDVEVYLYDENNNPAGKDVFNIKVKRFPSPDLGASLPKEDQVDRIRGLTTFFEFTDKLERGPHNTVHRLIGGNNPNPDPTDPFDSIGAMGDALISPADPLFWCHHANIDRLWAEWQKKQIATGNIEFMHPGLEGNELEMHPWFPEYTEPQTREIQAMGYTYDNM